VTTPTPDVREIARASIVAAFETVWGGVPDRAGEKLLHGYADAVLSAVTPVIRQQVAEEIAEKIDEKAEQIRRDAWTPTAGIALAAIMTDAAAVARSRQHRTEES